MVFVEQHLSDEYWHWKFQYYCDDFSREDSDEIYDWCLSNLNDIGGWHVRWNGVIIYNVDDAMAFKLTWM